MAIIKECGGKMLT